MWQPASKWYLIEQNAYDLMISQAEKRKEEALSESESLTNKSIRMLIAVAAMTAFFIIRIATKSLNLFSYQQYDNLFLLIIIVMLTGDLYFLFILVFPKDIKFQGYSPKDLFLPELSYEENKNVQKLLLSYKIMVLLQDDISIMDEKNGKRIKKYKWALFLTIGLLLVGGLYLLFLS